MIWYALRTQQIPGITTFDLDDILRKEESEAEEELFEKPVGGKVGNRGFSDAKKKEIKDQKALKAALRDIHLGEGVPLSSAYVLEMSPIVRFSHCVSRYSLIIANNVHRMSK